VAKSFGAKLVKNSGDAIIFYFPDTTDPANESAFRNMLECCATIIASRDLVNTKLHSEGIEESINFRISADYGTFEVASSMSGRNEDLFGPTMNVCVKINAKAEANGMVVGGDLCCILKAHSLDKDYKFKETGSYSVGKIHSYPVYTVSKYISKGNDFMFNPRKHRKSISAAGFSNHLPDIETGIMHNTRAFNDVDDKQHKKLHNILIVDDEPDIILLYKSFLSAEGYDAEVFTSSQEALANFAKFYSYYGLVILDIRMPHINGLQLYQRLKTINKDVRVVFVSALDIIEEVSALIPDFNNINILKKPVSKEQFLAAVNETLDRFA
jgi:CheY-like chemotaxis protein